MNNDQPLPDTTERVNQTPGPREDTVVQTTEEEDEDVKDIHDHQSNDVSHSQDAGTAGFDPSGNIANFQNMDWNANPGFNPMMNMSNMQPAWGGFNNMMGTSSLFYFLTLPKSDNPSHRHADGTNAHVRQLWRCRNGHERHEWNEHGHGFWWKLWWQLERTAGYGWQLWCWLLSQRWI